jgi:hypothetical protein
MPRRRQPGPTMPAALVHPATTAKSAEKAGATETAAAGKPRGKSRPKPLAESGLRSVQWGATFLGTSYRAERLRKVRDVRAVPAPGN